MKSYIVRVYRAGEGSRHNFVGTIEEPDIKGKKAFTTVDELWEILKPWEERKQKKRKKDPVGSGAT